jgi:hypothetical protein
MGWQNNIFPLLIVNASGGFTGLFVYSPAPGPGNLIGAITGAASTTDPYGNTVSSVFEAGAIGTNFVQIDQFGDLLLFSAGALNLALNPAKKAFFVYSPSSGAGNLVTSVAAAAGTDSFGNAYQSGIQVQGGGKITVGAAGGPEVQLISNAAITVTTNMGATGLAASNVTSFGTLQQVVELPSNNVNEKSPAIIGQTLITYTNGETADAVLHLSGTTSTGTFRGTFRLDICESSGLTFQQAVIEGVYTVSGSAVTLGPASFRGVATGQIGVYNPTGIEGPSGVPVNALAGFTDGALYPSAMEGWHSITPGNGWVNTIFYKLTSDNEVYLWSNALTAPAASANGVTIITLPSAYRPAVNMQVNIGALANSGAIPHLTLATTGTLQSTGVLASSGVFLNARVPLDL